MSEVRTGSDHRPEDWERSDRATFRVAMAIALLPIPAALLISWALGNPPWRTRPADRGQPVAPATEHPAGRPPEQGHPGARHSLPE